MLRLIAFLIALAFALTSVSPVLAQPKEPATKSDNTSPVTKDKVPAAKKEQLDINSASEDPLKALPGIGEAYAKRSRRAGRTSARMSLVQKKIMPQGTYDKIKDQIIAKQK